MEKCIVSLFLCFSGQKKNKKQKQTKQQQNKQTKKLKLF